MNDDEYIYGEWCKDFNSIYEECAGYNAMGEWEPEFIFHDGSEEWVAENYPHLLDAAKELGRLWLLREKFEEEHPLTHSARWGVTEHLEQDLKITDFSNIPLITIDCGRINDYLL